MKLFLEICGWTLAYILGAGFSFRFMWKNPQIRQWSGGYGESYSGMTLTFVVADDWVPLPWAVVWSIVWPLPLALLLIIGLCKGLFYAGKFIGTPFLHPELKPKKFEAVGPVVNQKQSPFNLEDPYLKEAEQEVNLIAPNNL